MRNPFKFKKKQIPQKEVKKILPTGYNVYYLGNNTPTWVNTQDLKAYENIINDNPVVFAVIDILSKAFANGRVKVKDLKTGDIYSESDLYNLNIQKKKLIQKAFRLINNPNPLQSRWEYLRSYLFFKKVFGNSFQYGNKPDNYTMNLETVQVIWNLWPQYMNVYLKGNYFNATDLSEIIDKWTFGYLADKNMTFKYDDILHRKEVNVNLSDTNDLIFGQSPLKPLSKPISNIEMGYESQNVVLKNRGARLVISPDVQPSDGFNASDPLEDDEKDELQEQFNDYGFLDGQLPNLVTKVPIKTTIIDQDIRKLGIFESIANDSLIVAHTLGVPEILVKLYIQGATFENQNASLKRLYQDTIIPEFDDYINDLNDWLRLEDFGLQYIPTFEHVAVLQEDFKERATANSLINNQFENQFMKGVCTWNEWRKALNQQPLSDGDKRIFELTPEQLQIIGITINQNGQNNNQ